MIIECWIADLAAVGSPVRAESEVFGLCLTFFCQVGPFFFVVGEPFYDLERGRKKLSG